MIAAKFHKEGDGICMTMRGHADSAPYGEDLICSAATMLAYTVAQAVQFMYENDKLKDKPEIILEEGNVMIKADPTEDNYAEALHTFWVAQCGMHVLAHNYPQNVKLEHLKV